MSQYASKEVSAAVTRRATPDELWLSEQIDPSLVEVMKRGQSAFVRMRDRYQRGLSFGFDGEGLQSAKDALDAYEVIVDASSPLQMLHAIRSTYKRITDGHLLKMPI